MKKSPSCFADIVINENIRSKGEFCRLQRLNIESYELKGVYPGLLGYLTIRILENYKERKDVAWQNMEKLKRSETI